MPLPSPLELRVETGWDPPSRAGRAVFRLGLLVDLIDALSGGVDSQPTTVGGTPKWRVVLADDRGQLAASFWTRDFPAAEKLLGHWQDRLQGMTVADIRGMARQQINL